MSTLTIITNIYFYLKRITKWRLFAKSRQTHTQTKSFSKNTPTYLTQNIPLCTQLGMYISTHISLTINLTLLSIYGDNRISYDISYSKTIFYYFKKKRKEKERLCQGKTLGICAHWRKPKLFNQMRSIFNGTVCILLAVSQTQTHRKMIIRPCTKTIQNFRMVVCVLTVGKHYVDGSFIPIFFFFLEITWVYVTKISDFKA